MFSCPFVSIRGSNQYLDYIRVHSCPFVVPPLPPSSCFFVYFVFFVVQTLLGLRFCIFVSIRVHSWFKPVFGLRSCPFVSIRGSPSPPPRVFRGSNTTWTTFVYIRVHSCPFVVLPLPPPSCFSCFSCFSWFDSPFTCLMRRAQARHPRTTLSSLLPTCPILSLFKETGIIRILHLRNTPTECIV